MKEKNRIKGKKNRASGQRFELKVRHELESKGWVVDKWSNNVELPNKEGCGKIIQPHPKVKMLCGEIGGGKQIYCDSCEFGKIIPAKRKFNPFKKVLGIGTGFPDFVAWGYLDTYSNRVVMGVEVKSNGYLDKIEKQKCKWLLDNHVFSKILIASKGEKRGTIKYKEFENEKQRQKNNKKRPQTKKKS